MNNRCKTIICDLDGTLCNVQHRVEHAERGDFDTFHAALIQDTPFAYIREMLQIYHGSGFEVIYLTGRPVRWLAQTEDWLRRHGVDFHAAILMRANDDDRPDPEFKKEVYCNQLAGKEIAFILEDRASVVRMWRSLGLNCLHVADGDF